MTDAPRLPIRTERLLLRTARPDDLPALLEYASDPDVVRYLPYGVMSETEMAERLEGYGHHVAPVAAGDRLTLIMEHEGRVMGDLMLRLGAGDPPSVAEVGWVSHPAYGGRGLVTEGARALVRLGFDHFGLHRVSAQLDPRNTASARLCERLGMRLEAHLRRDFWSKGEWSDTLIYGLLREEWDGDDAPGSG